MPRIEDRLRPYQGKLVADLRQAYRQGARAVLMQLATGGGKTWIFVAIAEGAIAKGNKTLILVHRHELLSQAADKVRLLGIEPGIIAPGGDYNWNAPVVIASVMSAVRRLDQMPRFGLIIPDEAHHAVAKSWLDIFASQPQAKLLGPTATPARADKTGLGNGNGGPFDALVCGPSTKELIDQGYLSKVRCFVPPQRIDRALLKISQGEFTADSLDEEFAKKDAVITGDILQHKARLAAGLPTIVFAHSVAYSQHLKAVFARAGYRSGHVDAHTPKAEREQLIGGLAEGSLEVLCNCALIEEGVDIPVVGAVILLRPTKSLVLHRQQVGRGMRPEPEGAPRKTLIIVDHVGNVTEHNPPDWEPLWSLDLKFGEPEEPAGEPWICPGCSALNPSTAPFCEHCAIPNPKLTVREPSSAGSGTGNGADDMPGFLDRELVEVVVDEGFKVRRAAKLHYRRLMQEIEAGQYSRAELLAIAREKKYKYPAGWVRYRVKEMIDKGTPLK